MWDVSVCVACLATDVRMYSMSSSSLLQPYQLLAGVQFGSHSDYLPQKLCWECAALVNKFNLFRQKCERAYLLLQDIYNQHDEILEEHVNNDINREQHLLTSSLGITHIPSYTLTSRSVTAMKDTSTELITYSVKPEVDIVKVEYRCPKTEQVFKSEPFVNCDEMVENFDNEEIANDVKESIKSKGDFKYELNVTNAEALPLASFSGNQEDIPPDAWTEIVMTQEQVNQLYKQKKNSLEFERATLKCELCYAVFNERHYYPRHMLKHQPSTGSYVCDFCKFRYKTRKSLSIHIKVHIRHYKCNICDAKLNTRAIAKSHFLRHKKREAVLQLRRENSQLRAQVKREAALMKRASKLKWKGQKKKLKNKASEYEAVQSFLTQEEMMAVVRERQLAKGYDTAPFKCHLCFKVFLENRTYSRHMILHDPVRGEFECDICKIRLKTRAKVFKHIAANHLSKYTCGICPTVTYNRGVARYHYEHHKGVKFMCHVCAATFSREPVLQLHMHAKHPAFTASNVCGECGTSFPTDKGLVCHKQHMHKIAAVPEENAPYCEECKVQFASRKAWTKHVLNSESHKDLQKDIVNGCRQCGETFHINEMLHRHRREQHPYKKQARCNVAVRRHVERRQPCALVATLPEENAPYCEECKVQFASRKAWTKHVLTSESHKDLQKDIVHGCKTCGETFNIRAALRRHRKEQHTDEILALNKKIVVAEAKRKTSHTKPQPCTLCGEQTTSFHKRWEHHRRCHPGQPYPRLKPARHACEQCGKRFLAKTTLEQHKLVHLGPPPLQCSACPKAFYMRTALQRHLSVTHSEERPYKCDTCDVSFKVKPALKRHLLVHTGERPYPCTECEKTYTTRDWLQLHVRKVHNKEHIPTKPRIRKRKRPV